MLLRLARRRLQSLRQASTGPIAAYNALVDAGKIKRDSHQLNAIAAAAAHLPKLETGHAPAPREVKADNEEASNGLMTKPRLLRPVHGRRNRRRRQSGRRGGAS